MIVRKVTKYIIQVVDNRYVSVYQTSDTNSAASVISLGALKHTWYAARVEILRLSSHLDTPFSYIMQKYQPSGV